MTKETPIKTEKTPKKISGLELAFIIIDGIIALGGLTMIVLGFIADYFPGAPKDNWTGQAAFISAMHISYRWFGAILLVVAAIVAAIFLNGFARKHDTDNERALRRAQRMKILSDSEKPNEEPVQEQTAQEVESKPVTPKAE